MDIVGKLTLNVLLPLCIAFTVPTLSVASKFGELSESNAAITEQLNELKQGQAEISALSADTRERVVRLETRVTDMKTFQHDTQKVLMEQSFDGLGGVEQ